MEKILVYPLGLYSTESTMDSGTFVP